MKTDVPQHTNSPQSSVEPKRGEDLDRDSSDSQTGEQGISNRPDDENADQDEPAKSTN